MKQGFEPDRGSSHHHPTTPTTPTTPFPLPSRPQFFLPPLSGVEVGAAAFAARTASRLAVALQSQASTSLIGFGQISKVQESNPKLGYDLDLAFQIVSLSFPLSVLLNTATVLGGRAYVDSLAWVGVGLCGLSGAVYLAFKKQIDQL